MMAEILRPKTITLNDSRYYNADDLQTYDAAYFHGCSRTVRKIIDKKKINSETYIYATWSKKNNWVVAPNQAKPSNKAKLLFLEEWVLSHIPKMMPESEETKNAIIEAAYECPEAPPLLQLSDGEKFKDADGNVVEIEARGERTSDGIYFLAKDVATVFEMPRLIDVLNDKNTKYVLNDHYQNFYMHIPNTIGNTEQKKQLFITYKGMLKILFTSRSGAADKFVDWATKTLFTVQMGTADQKEDLVSGIIGIPAKSLRQVLKTSVSSVPCIYRFALGAAKDLRKKMNLCDTIPDDFIIIKYGFTEDLVRRTGEHIKTYEKITGGTLELMNYVYVDPKYLSQAEVDIKEFFASIETPIQFEAFSELIAINPKHERTITKQFKYMHTEYAGAVKDLIEKINILKQEIKDKDVEITHLKEKHMFELELKNKDLTNKDLVNQLLELKLQNALK